MRVHLYADPNGAPAHVEFEPIHQKYLICSPCMSVTTRMHRSIRDAAIQWNNSDDPIWRAYAPLSWRARLRRWWKGRRVTV